MNGRGSLANGSLSVRDRITPNFPAVFMMAMSLFASLYFIFRFTVRRRAVSIGIALMCCGWAVVGLIVNGVVERDSFYLLSWIGLGVSAAMLASVLKQEFWTSHDRDVEKNKEREEEDRRLRGE